MRERGGEGGDTEEEDMEDHTGVSVLSVGRDRLGLMLSTQWSSIYTQGGGKSRFLWELRV